MEHDNEFLISLADLNREYGLRPGDLTLLGDFMESDRVPALCSEGCEVRPHSRCEHDCPSILMAAGMIF
jgi:hypothetical protein